YRPRARQGAAREGISGHDWGNELACLCDRQPDLADDRAHDRSAGARDVRISPARRNRSGRFSVHVHQRISAEIIRSRTDLGQRMTVFSVGKATISRIEETYQPVYSPKDLFPEFTDEIFREHKHWLAPNHYDPASGKVKLSVHSWLLQIGEQKILIDACCGNHKSRPTRHWWNMLDTPYLERLAAAGARP